MRVRLPALVGFGNKPGKLPFGLTPVAVEGDAAVTPATGDGVSSERHPQFPPSRSPLPDTSAHSEKVSELVGFWWAIPSSLEPMLIKNPF